MFLSLSQGPQGRNGRDGKDGLPGVAGPPGPPGLGGVSSPIWQTFFTQQHPSALVCLSGMALGSSFKSAMLSVQSVPYSLGMGSIGWS